MTSRCFSGKFWPNTRFRPFTFPSILTREQSLRFCVNNNGTLMFWADLTEEQLVRGSPVSVISSSNCAFFSRVEFLLSTTHQLFRYERNQRADDRLTFFIGLKQTNGVRQWESTVKRAESGHIHPRTFVFPSSQSINRYRSRSTTRTPPATSVR
jgi:hypothetical protein